MQGYKFTRYLNQLQAKRELAPGRLDYIIGFISKLDWDSVIWSSLKCARSNFACKGLKYFVQKNCGGHWTR